MIHTAKTHKQNILPWLLASLFLVALGLLAAVGLALLYYVTQTEEATIAQGVTVAGLDLGGQTPPDAQRYFAENNPHRQITLVDGERSWQMDAEFLGIGVDIASTIAAAQVAPRDSALQPHYLLNLDQTQLGLVDLSLVANIPASRTQAGRALEIPVMLDRLYQDVGGELADGVLDLSMIELPPPPEDSPNLSATQTTIHVVEAGQELGLIAREYGVTVDDILALNALSDPNLIDIGQELLIPAEGVYQPNPSEVPSPPTTAGKAIVVSVGEQRIYAFEDGQLVHSHLTSTGLPETPTVYGDYKIYVKYASTTMSGPGYYLPNVPYTMYFYQGYGIHGAYWHNSFGRPMSHGCVNLPLDEAEWFFNWAEVGTPVRVI